MSFVDVVIITYNQEKLIEQALLSVLSQKTDKIANIFVCNDHSTDQTGNIIEKISSEFPCRISHILRSQNFGMNANFRDAVMSCVSPYIAFLEGDDFWCDENKIERQFAVIEINPQFVACAHPIKAVDESGKDLNLIYPEIDVSAMQIFDPFKVIPNYPPGFHINSLFARTKILQTCFIKEYDQLPIGDVPLNYLLIQTGKIAYIPEPLAVWRRHNSHFNGLPILIQCAKGIQAHLQLLPYLNSHMSPLNNIRLNLELQIWNNLLVSPQNFDQIESVFNWVYETGDELLINTLMEKLN